MSNHLTFATVTAALRTTLQAALDDDLPGARVTTSRPDAVTGNPPPASVNVFLYQITPNAAGRNADLPTRSSDGSTVQRPRAAFDLHYLFSFYGDETQLVPQRLLGTVARTLHERPVLTHSAINRMLADPTFNFLIRSNLSHETELVRFTPTSLSLDELSKLWSVFFQTPYALSATYQGTVVFIDGEERPLAALPVQQRLLYVGPLRQPQIEAVQAGADPTAPIQLGVTLRIIGKHLGGTVTRVRIGGREVTGTIVSDRRVDVALASPPFPPDALRAGVQAVQVLQPLMLGEPPTAHAGAESNVAAIVVRPTITSVVPADHTLQVTTDVVVGKTQRVVLLLNELHAEPGHSYAILAPPRDADSRTLQFATDKVEAGVEYVIRVQVDGAESLVNLDPGSAGFGPHVRLP